MMMEYLAIGAALLSALTVIIAVWFMHPTPAEKPIKKHDGKTR